MRRYRERTATQATLVGPPGDAPIDLRALFGRTAPVRIEFGCGHGEFMAAIAAAHPDEDFLGVEIDHLRVTKIAHKCIKSGATNARIFAGSGEAFVERLPDACTHRIYILFSDPWPKLAHRRRRLVNRAFLQALARIAAPGCQLIMRTDTHEYALSTLSNATTLPGLWRATLPPSGYAIDLPVRFPTLFEHHKRAEGCTIAQVTLVRQG